MAVLSHIHRTRPVPDQTLARLAYHDILTDLPNRAALAARLPEALQRADIGGQVVMLCIDLDDFKLVNDGLGHDAGDELLRQVARRLEGVRRAGDLIARQGGDEFVMLIELGSGSDAAGAAESIGLRIAEAFESPFTVHGTEFRIGASVGAAAYPADARDAETLHRHADAALYTAKESGGGFAAFRSERSDPLARLSMAAALRQAIGAGELSLHYQPIYRLPGRELVGVEALCRWNDPDRGAVGPEEFIPVAEKTGVIAALGDWVLERVCSDAAAWQAEGLRPNFGVNVSPRQLQRHNFAAHFSSIAARYGIDPSRLVLELTESAWTLEAARAARALHELTEAGFVLAIDDFGAGYSSLARLRHLPVRVIKIDRAFMAGIPEDPQAVAIVEAILALANACGCDVVSEGVEDEAQTAFLCARNVALAQGFGLSVPVDFDTVTELLRAQLHPERRSPPRA